MSFTSFLLPVVPVCADTGTVGHKTICREYSQSMSRIYGFLHSKKNTRTLSLFVILYMKMPEYWRALRVSPSLSVFLP